MSPSPRRKRVAAFAVAGLLAAALCVALYLWLPRTEITIAVYDPPLVYIGANEAKELAKRIPQLETRLEMTAATTLEEYHRWITPQLASRRSARPERSGTISEVLERSPRGVAYALIEISKGGRQISLIVHAAGPPEPGIYRGGENKPLLSFIKQRGRWLAAAADELPIKELHEVINATALHDLEHALSKTDLNVLLREL